MKTIRAELGIQFFRYMCWYITIITITITITMIMTMTMIITAKEYMEIEIAGTVTIYHYFVHTIIQK